MQSLESSEIIWFLKCCLNCKMMLLSGMCSQRVRKLTLNIVEPPRFVSPVYLFFSLRGVWGSWTSWVVAGTWELVKAGVWVLQFHFSPWGIHSPGATRKNKISQTSKWNYCSTPSLMITLSTFEFLVVVFHARPSLMLSINIYWMPLYWGRERWIVKDQGGSPVDSEVPHLVCICVEKEKKKRMLIPHTWII